MGLHITGICCTIMWVMQKIPKLARLDDLRQRENSTRTHNILFAPVAVRGSGNLNHCLGSYDHHNLGITEIYPAVPMSAGVASVLCPDE